MKLALLTAFGTVLLCLVPAAPAAADFAIRDGDTVVFLGDSITAARAYGKIVENYTLLRYPNRKVRFINAGHGGDTAAGGLKRLERDVFQKGATLLTVAYGINDIGWGMKTDEEHRQAYLDAIRGIVEQCKKRGVRVYICSAAVTAADPSTSEASVLQTMCDEGMAIARSRGEGAIDVERTMRSIQKKVWAYNAQQTDEKKKETLHAADGIHLNNLGQLAMAYAILKGLGAPADVSAVSIDAARSEVLAEKGCRISSLSGNTERLEFDRLDDGLPINFGLFGALSFRFVPIPDELNRYMLTVHNLKDGRYEVVADDRPLGKFTSRQLDSGVNIASATPDAWQPGGPWDAQATILISLTDARNEIATADGFTSVHLTHNPNEAAIRHKAEVLNAGLEDLQRTLVQPTSFHFVIRHAAEKD